MPTPAPPVIPDAVPPAESSDAGLPPPARRLSAWLAAQALAFGRALRAGLLGALFRPSAARHVEANVPALLMLITLSLLPLLADGLWHQGLAGQFNPWGLPTWAFPHSLA